MGWFVNRYVHHLSAIETYELIGKLKNNTDFKILDIRTKEEYYQGHLPGAICIDYSDWEFESILDQLDRDRNYLVYCRSGARSSDALELFEELNFSNIYHMKDGIIDWRSHNLHVVCEG